VQSDEAQTRKHIATLDERLDILSQKLARELSMGRVPPHAIERMALANGFTSRISNTANMAVRAIQRIPAL